MVLKLPLSCAATAKLIDCLHGVCVGGVGSFWLVDRMLR